MSIAPTMVNSYLDLPKVKVAKPATAGASIAGKDTRFHTFLPVRVDGRQYVIPLLPAMDYSTESGRRPHRTEVDYGDAHQPTLDIVSYAP